MGDMLAPMAGLGVFDTRLNPDTLEAVGVGTRDSAYTESGPIPGHPVPADLASRWRPMVRGAQSVDLDLLTLRGGFPGRNGTSGVAYRLTSDTLGETDWRSWDEPNLITDWTTPDDAWGAAATWDDVTACLIPSTQKIIVVARSSTDAQTWEYDPRTELWTNLFDWTGNPGLQSPIAIAYDEETERLLLWSGDGTEGDRSTIGFQSTDGGSTWTIYTRGQYDTTVDSAGGRMIVATAVGADWLAITPIAATPTLRQMASSDRGVTWEDVGGFGSTSDHFPVRTSSGYVVVYSRDADGFLCCRLLGSARSLFTDAAEIEIWGFDTVNIVACRDYDGVLYVYARNTGGTVSIHRSLDDGATWAQYGSTSGTFESALAAVGATVLWRACLPACGSVYNIGLHGSATRWHMARFGGWTTVEQASRGTVGSFRGGLARFGAGETRGADYIALEFPDTYGGWTRTGAAGTRTMSGARPGLELVCTQAQNEAYQSAAATGDWCAGGFRISTSAATPPRNPAAGPTFNSGLSFQPVIDDGTSRWRAYIEIGSDGYAVWDGATRRAALTISAMSTEQVHFRYFMTKGAITVWHRRIGTTKWVRGADEVVITAGATVAVANHLAWGHAAAAIAGTSTLYVQYVYHSAEASFRHELDNLQSSDNAYTSGVLGLAYGRRVPGRGDAYPIPDATSTTEEIGYLTAVGGPTKVAETVSLPAGHTYAIEHVHPDTSASPRVQWRATDTTLVSLTYDQGAGNESWYGGALALAALRADFRTATIETDNGGVGWTTIGTLDKGWSSINYTLTGRTVVPRAGTATIDRYFAEGSLVGGYLICSTGGTAIARRIASNSPGVWSATATTQRIRIELEDVDGTEAAAGTGELVAPSGVFVAYPTSEPARRYVRVQIPAGQIVPGARYAAGILAVARVVGFGGEQGWDWSDITELSRTTSRSADDSLSIRRRGPPRRIVTAGWTDGVDLRTMRTLAADADFVGVQTGIAIGTAEDVWSSPIALIEHQLRSGEVPALAFRRLPGATSTITDESLLVYGVVQSDRVGRSGIAGTEGLDEVVRVDGIAIEERR